MEEEEETIMEILVSKGWRFRDPDELRALIRSKPSPLTVDAVEADLLNMDMRSLGGKSLPDSCSLYKSSHLLGPKVLQVVSVRDVSQSTIDAAAFRNPQRQHRLLRFNLTDGHSQVTAIEYSPIPSITEEIIPGTKVRLENKIPIHSGILCLNAKLVAIMGGLVQPLYEEWQMSMKYSGFSRSSMRLPQNDDNVGPPPFEKLRIDARPQLRSSHDHSKSSKIEIPLSGDSDTAALTKDIASLTVGVPRQAVEAKVNKTVEYSKPVSLTRSFTDKPSTSETRTKEVSEAVPVQNQAAALKLLQKMSQQTHEGRQPRGDRHRSRGKQEAPVFTLDEWERRKASNFKPVATGQSQDISCDEELAQQLQQQLDLEDFHKKTGDAEAQQIRMSMFNFGGSLEERNEGRREFRGGGRGRGRGRGRKRFA